MDMDKVLGIATLSIVFAHAQKLIKHGCVIKADKVVQ